MLTTAFPQTVTLKDGREIVIRPLARGDFDMLYAFFQALSEEDRLYMRHDVRDPHLVRKWAEELDFKHVIPLVAVAGDKIVADGTLHIATHGWMQHVAHLRLVIATTHRTIGLGTRMARELVALAEERGLEKLQVHVIEDQVVSVRMFQSLGFEIVSVLQEMVKDQDGRKRNLAIMINDVGSLTRALEDWIQDSMIPEFRSPGEG